MVNVQWTNEDFNVFNTEGLNERMEALSKYVRPKFQMLGDLFTNYFSTNLGDEFFPHIAKHARRTVNPPKDSWIAFAPYKRGYKSLPHFQIGLWNNFLFIVLAIIYEAPQKQSIAERLLHHIDVFDTLPDDFIVSGDHTSQDAISLKDARKEQLESLLVRLKNVKKGEFLVGLHIPKDEAIKLSSDEFLKLTEKTFDSLLPIYKIMVGN